VKLPDDDESLVAVMCLRLKQKIA